MKTKQGFKKSKEELEQYFFFKKRGFSVKPKKGKGSYNRKKNKIKE